MPMGIAIGRNAPVSVDIAKSALGMYGPLITVGDVVTNNVIKYWRIPDLAIIDSRTRRRSFADDLGIKFDVVLRLKNPPGTLSDEALGIIDDAVREVTGGSRVIIKVDGEEDLLAIPAVLKAPRSSLLLYGLYTGYLVVIPVVEEYRLAMLKLMSMLIPRRGL